MTLQQKFNTQFNIHVVTSKECVTKKELTCNVTVVLVLENMTYGSVSRFINKRLHSNSTASGISTCLHFHRATAMEGKVGIQNKEWNFGKALTLCLPERWKKYLNKINIQNLLSAKPGQMIKEYNQEYYKTRLTEEDTHCHSNDITQTLTVFCHRKSITVHYDSPCIP